MNEIQDIYSVYPFKGYRRICNDLNDLGHIVNHKRILRLMRILKLQLGLLQDLPALWA